MLVMGRTKLCLASVDLLHECEGDLEIALRHLVVAQRQKRGRDRFFRYLEDLGSILTSLDLQGLLDVSVAHVDSRSSVFVCVELFRTGSLALLPALLQLILDQPLVHPGLFSWLLVSFGRWR